ncbi:MULTISPECIES: pyridoxal phosphate-dependent aminotransferase [Halomonas]|uniref:pyridoxal phosphate-dependent aminotransferase n=1 Tax=Halomonas TaxID=2745 RepID=UPI001C939AC0|nr:MULTISPECIES: pyridoxal phosphate-dependent aminotransferase [Halomonas]MBY6207055.1 pyridoxal phosphate-dependent aminotransferase [Halomonas sp. DP3Y7-2]MBY6229649.1 pyridoxal phosphate-dependent aminotransferase [Halomonas sp. DP3Y7-1]MCA0918019.1 pyridoxal phosphate-dependent aminotransferase [Halomonas denitrificans]
MTRVSRLTQRIAGEGAAAWDIHSRALARQANGEDITVLSVGDPDFTTPRSIVEAAKHSLDQGATHYADVQGKLALREAIVSHYRRSQRLGHVELTPDRLIVMAGAQCGLYAAAQCLLDPGDEVIVPEPCYVTYEAVIQATGATLSRVSLQADQGFRLNVDDVAAAITHRTKAILINSPHNPTGQSLTREQWKQVAALCQQHDLWLISDEVYAELMFDGTHTCPLALPEMAERSVVISSLSKSHAMTGWRLGWVIAPPMLIEHLSHLALCMLYGCPDFVQDAAITALADEQGQLGDDLATMHAAYQARRDSVCAALAGSQAAKAVCPDAGMFVMVDIRATGLSSAQFADRLLDQCGISVLSGEAFGPSAAGFIRLGLTHQADTLADAAQRLREFADACLATHP